MIKIIIQVNKNIIEEIKDERRTVEIIVIEDDIGDFLKEKRMKKNRKNRIIQPTPQLPKRDEHYESFDYTTPEEIAKIEKMIREDRKRKRDL
ncbi:MAG: hypothetical protein LBG48_03280 [Rickettsiales bacterium]|nr:hypothetical protein [Rickettsiales bacterium]